MWKYYRHTFTIHLQEAPHQQLRKRKYVIDRQNSVYRTFYRVKNHRRTFLKRKVSLFKHMCLMRNIYDKRQYEIKQTEMFKGFSGRSLLLLPLYQISSTHIKCICWSRDFPDVFNGCFSNWTTSDSLQMASHWDKLQLGENTRACWKFIIKMSTIAKVTWTNAKISHNYLKQCYKLKEKNQQQWKCWQRWQIAERIFIRNCSRIRQTGNSWLA